MRLESLEQIGDILEPFDPEYLTNKEYVAPELSAYEKKFLHKVGIMESKLKKEKIRFEWLPDIEEFRIKKFRKYSEYPVYMYLRVNVDENEYAFGDENMDLVYDSHISVVIDAAKKWLNNLTK